jgi:hypothetical protein
MNTMIEFHHGALSDTYEKQANDQGLTFGDDAEWVQKVAYGIVCAYIHGCITDGEYDRILQKFQKNILMKRLSRLTESEVSNV